MTMTMMSVIHIAMSNLEKVEHLTVNCAFLVNGF